MRASLGRRRSGPDSHRNRRNPLGGGRRPRRMPSFPPGRPVILGGPPPALPRSPSSAPSSRPRGVSVLVVLLAAGMLTACSPTVPDPAPGESANPLAARHTWGGMCAEGPCASALEVTEDGRWTWEDGWQEHRGQLSPQQLSRLRRAVADTGLLAATDDAPACAADADGTAVRYGWATADGWASVSSCDVLIEGRDPLVRALEGLAAELVD